MLELRFPYPKILIVSRRVLIGETVEETGDVLHEMIHSLVRIFQVDDRHLFKLLLAPQACTRSILKVIGRHPVR